MKMLSIIDFDTTDDLVDELIDNTTNEEDYTMATVVCDTDLAVELLHKLFAIDDTFFPAFIDIDTVDYDGYYYLTVTSDCEVFCERVEHDGVCYLNESHYTYIQDSVPESMVQYFGDEWKVIFGIDEE